MRPRRPGPRYALEITIVLVVKLIALLVIWNIWFAGPSRNHVGPEGVAEKLYSGQSAAPEEGAKRAGP
jgi:hypothetical protein